MLSESRRWSGPPPAEARSGGSGVPPLQRKHPPLLPQAQQAKSNRSLPCAVPQSTSQPWRPSLGPEALYRLLQAWMALAHEVIQHYDGTITPGVQ